MSSITVSNETNIDLGNSGSFCNFYQANSFDISLASESGVYYPADDYYIAFRQTNVFFVSGTVATGGSLVSLTPSGDIPAEFNGNGISANATIITPEIFLPGSATEDGEPVLPPADPPLDDGKVSDHANVILLLHGNETPLIDSSIPGRTLLVSGDAAYDPLRKAFGAGSIKFPANTTNNGVYTETL